MSETAIRATKAHFRNCEEQMRIYEERKKISLKATQTARYLEGLLDSLKRMKND